MMRNSKMNRNIFSNQEGSVIISFALMLNILILAIALSLDLGRGFMASSAISGAADAAAIASAVGEGDAEKAQAYFESNLPAGTLGVEYDYTQNVLHAIDSATNDISITTSGFNVPTYVSSGTNGSGALQLANQVVVGSASSTPAPADIVIIMDASGSMGFNPKISGGKVTGYNPIAIDYTQNVFKYEALEAAVLSFLQIIEPHQGTGPDGLPLFRVSLKSYDSGLRGDLPFDDKILDLAIKVGGIVAPGSATNAGIALEAGRGELANSLAGRRNIYIFLTDGEINQPKGGPWLWPADYTGVTTTSVGHQYAASECHDIKIDPDVDFWTIGFGAGANTPLNKDVLEYCATIPSQYVTPTNGDELSAIFTQVALQISSVRIKK